jgi:cytochrome c oxidase subunit II
MSSDQPGTDAPPVVPQGDSIVPARPFFSRPVGKIFIIWFLMTAVGVLIGIFAPHHLMTDLLSHEATDVWRTMVLFTILAAPVAAVVYAVAAYSLIGWRHRGNQDEPPDDGPPLRGNSTVTAIWLGTSSVLVLALLAWGLSVYSAEEVSHPNTLQIDVTGQQWLWTFNYPGTGVNTRTLVLPVNRPVQFNVTSVDVTHGFWPVSLGVQVDANPGVVTVIRATPDKLGSFTVRCSQLCGLYHSFMYAPGLVVSSAKFSQWLQSQGASTTTAQATALVKKR